MSDWASATGEEPRMNKWTKQIGMRTAVVDADRINLKHDDVEFSEGTDGSGHPVIGKALRCEATLGIEGTDDVDVVEFRVCDPVADEGRTALNRNKEAHLRSLLLEEVEFALTRKGYTKAKD